MPSHCQDDSSIKGTCRLAIDNQLYTHGKHSNRSAPNLLANVAPAPETISTSPHGFRVQLHHLLPRHAYFRARVQIHQISNIPLVSGRFSVKWKFKNVHSAPGARHGLLGIVKTRSRPGTPLAQIEFQGHALKGKGKEDIMESDHGNYSPTNSDEHAVPSVIVSPFTPGRSVPVRPDALARLHSRPSTSSGSTSSSRSNMISSLRSHDDKTSGAPSPLSFHFLHRPSSASHAFSPAQSMYPGSPQPLISPMSDVQTPRAPSPMTPTLLPPKSKPAGLRDSASSARGKTTVSDLRDHSVAWQHTVTTVLRMDVARDTGVLASSSLKLVVLQHAVRDDPANVPQNPRLGALYLNMAEYVDKGTVQRKYLLKESKINAILNLTIELEHIGGATDYKAPPLPKGEILNGITSLLERDIYYDPRSKEPISLSRNPSQSSKFSSDASSDGHRRHFGSPVDPRLSFNVEGLHRADGARHTQALIDTLFNPILTTEREGESPFTLYVSQDKREYQHVHDRLDANPRRNPQNLEVASVCSTVSSSEDAWTMARTVSSNSSVAPSIASSTRSAKIRKLHLSLAPDCQVIETVEAAPSSARSVKGWFKRRTDSRPATPSFGRFS